MTTAAKPQFWTAKREAALMAALFLTILFLLFLVPYAIVGVSLLWAAIAYLMGLRRAARSGNKLLSAFAIVAIVVAALLPAVAIFTFLPKFPSRPTVCAIVTGVAYYLLAWWSVPNFWKHYMEMFGNLATVRTAAKPAPAPQTEAEQQLKTTKKHWRGLSPGARRFLIADAAKAYIYPDIETQGENNRVINTDEIEASIPDDPDAQLDYLASIWPALSESAQTKVACLTGAFTLSEHWDALNDGQRRRGLAMANIIREGIGLPPLTDIGGANPFTQTNQDIEEKNKPSD